MPPERSQERSLNRSPAWAEQLVASLDDKFRIPGTNLRFGLDSLLGLLPVGGDALGAVATISLFYLAVQQGVPRPVLLRMALNVGIDALIGSVPILGDLFDLVWKANRKNLQLIEQNAARHGAPPSKAALWKDRLVLAGIVLLVLSFLALPFVLIGLALGALFRD